MIQPLNTNHCHHLQLKHSLFSCIWAHPTQVKCSLLNHILTRPLHRNALQLLTSTAGAVSPEQQQSFRSNLSLTMKMNTLNALLDHISKSLTTSNNSGMTHPFSRLCSKFRGSNPIHKPIHLVKPEKCCHSLKLSMRTKFIWGSLCPYLVFHFGLMMSSRLCRHLVVASASGGK